MINLENDAFDAYRTACERSETCPVEFENQDLSSYEDSQVLDEDPETDQHLHGVIRAILGGDRSAADAPYWGFLETQLDELDFEAELNSETVPAA